MRIYVDFVSVEFHFC